MTCRTQTPCLLQGFLLTHPVWDVTAPSLLWLPTHLISTHTSRVGCDQLPYWYGAETGNFYSHIPCGMWHGFILRGVQHLNFYSHIPCGMWLILFTRLDRWFNFYSHIPCGMWRIKEAHYLLYIQFLLTHPVWDVTRSGRYCIWNSWGFLLTHPVWDVTLMCFFTSKVSPISTHTSRVGCDDRGFNRYIIPDISTHTSRVGCDLEALQTSAGRAIFLLTHPVWDVTIDSRKEVIPLEISTHTSRVGCDL